MSEKKVSEKMRVVEIHPTGRKFRVTLFIDGKYEDDWIVEKYIINEETPMNVRQQLTPQQYITKAKTWDIEGG